MSKFDEVRAFASSYSSTPKCKAPIRFPVVISSNVNRALAKMDHIRALFSAMSAQIFVATESWFSDSHTNDIASIIDCCLFRDDRTDGRVGGGVAVWVKTFLRPVLFQTQGASYGTNSVWLVFHSLKMCLVCLYLPPSSVIGFSTEIINFIVSNLDSMLGCFPEYSLFITGDFNRIDISYLCQAFDLKNTVSEPTRGAVILDYVLLSPTLLDHYVTTVGPPVATSDHSTIMCSPIDCILPVNSKSCILYDLRDSCVSEFLKQLHMSNFLPVYDMSLSTDEKTHIFTDLVSSAFMSTIPHSTVLMTPRDKPYITPLIKHLINRRWAAYRQRNFPLYNHLRIKVKQLIMQEKCRWASRASKSSRQLWQVVNQIKGTKSSKFSALENVIAAYPSSVAAADDINSVFLSNQAVRQSPSIPPDYLQQDTNNWAPIITQDAIFKLLDSLGVHKASGLDNIPTVLYKKAAHILTPPLTHIINVSLSRQQFPSCWKHSVITPVPKTLPPTREDLRPISLLPVLSKICEKAVLDSGISARLRECFGNLQFGNVPLSSTTTALICLHEKVTRLLDMQNVIGVSIIAYDFSKAFDQVGHDVIVNALVASQFPLGFIRWIEDYLNARTQAVKVYDTISSRSPVTSGIPQGSVLGPFLFNLVISSLHSVHPSSSCIKYVDDCTFVIPMFRDSQSACLVEHAHMVSWSSSIGLQLNLRKCKHLFISNVSSCDPPLIADIQLVKELKILGVTFTSDLKWNHHLGNVHRLASSRMHALRILKPIVDKAGLVAVYKGLILSIIEYCSPLMVGMLSKDKSLVNRINNRVHRFVCGQECDCKLFPDLQSRRYAASSRLLHKISSSPQHLLHRMCPPKTIRGRYIVPPIKTVRRRNSFFPYMTILTNQIALD